jgi:hypothetical protein
MPEDASNRATHDAGIISIVAHVLTSFPRHDPASPLPLDGIGIEMRRNGSCPL